MSNTTNKENAGFPFGKAAIIIVVLMITLCVGFAVLNIDTKAVFVIASVAVGTLLVVFGCKLEDVLKWFTDGAKGSMEVILILMSVGTVIGTWMASGTVPTIIYYGLKLLTPASFMTIGFMLSCLVSFFIGSSYSTLATIGVACIGIGTGLGMNLGLVAGMCVSGALFGDKMSPFSDTTNMAAAVSGTTVYKHIVSMLYTVIPALVISFVLYAVFGAQANNAGADMATVNEMIAGLEANFNITPVLFCVPVIMLVLAFLKVPPVVAMLGSSLTAIIFGAFTQSTGALNIFLTIANGNAMETGNAAINRIVNRGGISSMMEVIAWTIITMGMGQMLKDSGVLDAFLSKLKKFLAKPRDLVIGTLLFSLVTACLTAAQYLAIMLPGIMLRDEYTKHKLDKKLLSRTLEDGGTMFSFMIPWDTAGIYTASVLMVPTLTYAPYAFLLLLCPVIAAIYACVGFAQFKEEEAK